MIGLIETAFRQRNILNLPLRFFSTTRHLSRDRCEAVAILR